MGTMITCPPNMSVASYLVSQTIKINTACGGRGNCAKCLVRIVRGEAPVTDMTRIQLSEEEIADGIRLACHIFPTEEIEVELL